MTKNEDLMSAAKEAIDRLFGDRSVSASVARDNLQEIIDECQIKLDSLDI